MSTHGLNFLDGGGEMGALMQAHDWSSSPLGDPATWPQSLRSVVGLLLSSRFPMFMAWGPDLGFLYNDPYAEILGAKHPAALGRRFQEVWAEIWPDIAPLIDAALAGEPSYWENLPLVVNRKGFDEQTWFTFSYSPVRDERGRIVGMYCACTETTRQVLAERRQTFRLTLDERLRDDPEPRAVMDAAAEVLGRHLGASRVGYSEVQADDETIVCTTCHADEVEPVFGVFRLDDFGPDSIARQRGGETSVCDDVAVDPRQAQAQATWTAMEARAFVSVPLVRDGRFTASLYVNSREPRRWTREEVALIEEVAARTWDAVERARAEAERQAFAERNVEILESISDAFYAVDRDWRFTYVNRKAEEWWRRKREDLIGKVYWEEFPQAVGSEPYKAHLRAAATREVVRLESVSPVLGHWVDISIYPTADGGLSVYFRDISEKKQAEERLRESEARLKLALEAGQLAEVTFVLPDGIIHSPAYAELLGYPPDKRLTFDELRSRYHPEDHDRVVAERTATLAGGQAFHEVEKRIVRPDGQVRWLYGRGSVDRDEQGRAVSVTAVYLDETDRKAAEVALRESEARLRAVIDAAPVGLVFADASGRITGANARIEEILGRPIARSDDVERYRDDYVAFHADGRRVEGHEYPLARVVRGEAERAELEVRVQLPDGALRWVRYIATPIKDERGGVIGAVVASLDVDREKRLAEDLAREVEAAVAELKAAHEQLRQSQKLDAMGQLTGGVAHDFNNLLTPIIGSLDMLMTRGVGTERERRLIDGALQSAERAKTLVQRLLAFARRQPLQPGPVDVARLVGGMADLVASTSGPKVEVRVEMPDDLPPATADANQLEMAVLNLAVNARDAMPEGGVLTISGARVSVRPGRSTKLRPGHYVRLSVSDTGVGMDEATLARAVEPFFSTKGVGRGTGLGLSMVHGLVSQLNGGLTIASRLGEGTTVALWLPISAVAAAADDDQSLGDAAPREALGTALLVDDEALVRMSTADMLMDLGYEVVEAGSAEEALRLIGQGLEPDLLVTDHLMPGMSGEELARALRLSRPALPVLVVSGYAEAAGIAPGLPRLTKPFRSAELAARVAALTPAGAVAGGRPG